MGDTGCHRVPIVLQASPFSSTVVPAGSITEAVDVNVSSQDIGCVYYLSVPIDSVTQDFYHQCDHSNWDNPTEIGMFGQSVCGYGKP